ncbi:MAG: TonB-dependent receptor [bacterium]|nr:TonB-dependent receptor [bacterium]
MINRVRLVLTILVFDLLVHSSFASEITGNLQGRVLDSESQIPVAEAIVLLKIVDPDTTGFNQTPSQYLDSLAESGNQYRQGGRLQTFADSTGTFEFVDLPSGRVVLSFPNPGFLSLEVPETISSGVTRKGEYLLTAAPYNEFEIVVRAKGPEKEVSTQSMSVEELEMLPGFGGDVIKSLQALPGVARPVMSNPGAVIVRGSGNYDTRFFLDGVDIPMLFHFGGVKSIYNSLSLNGVDLYPGGFGTRYGGCIGGVVELTGKPARNDEWHTVLDASLLDASFHTEGPIGKGFALTLSGRRSFVGEIAALALKNIDDVNMAVAPYYWDAVARLDYGLHTNHEFFLTFFAANDRMEMIVPDASSGSPEVSEATDTIALDLSFSRFIFGYDGDLSDRIRNELRVSAGKDYNSGHALGEFRFEGKGPLYSLRDDLAITWRPGFVSHFGLDMVYSPYDYSVRVNGYPNSSFTDKKFSDVGTYANFDWRLAENWVLTTGLRYDYYHHLDEGKPSVRAGTRWDYHEDRTWTASAGTYNQAPRPIGQSTDPVYGNPELPPTTARHLTLGHEWRLKENLTLKIEGYHNTQDQVPTFADTNDVNFLPDAEARMYGLEFMLRKQAGDRFFGWLAYSFGRSERRFSRDPGTGENWSPHEWNMHDMDQTHHLEAIGSWKFGHNWTFGSRIQFVSGIPVTPNLGYTSNRYEFNADTGEYVVIEGEYLSDRMEPYFRTDLRIDKSFYQENTTWSVYLDLQNANYFIYNSPEGYTYNYDYSKRQEYGWIFMPALGVRLEF